MSLNSILLEKFLLSILWTSQGPDVQLRSAPAEEVQWWPAADHSEYRCSSLVCWRQKHWLAASWPRRSHDAPAAWAYAGGKSTYCMVIRFTCCLRLSSLSSSTPRSRTTSVGWTTTESIMRVLSATDSRRRDVREPNQISSVFEAFSCSRQHAHHSCRSLMQDVRRWRPTWIHYASFPISSIVDGLIPLNFGN